MALDVLLTVLTGAVIAGAYGYLVYRRRLRQDPETEFNAYKLAATVLVGAAWGGVIAFRGGDVSQEQVQGLLVTYVGLVALTETVLKFLVEEYKHWRG